MTNNRIVARRLQLLGSAGLAMLAVAPAFAAGTRVTDTSVDSPVLLGNLSNYSIGFESVYSYPVNTGPVASSVVNASGGVTNTDTYNGTTTSSTSVLTTNTIAAQATGNTFTNTAPVDLLDSGLATVIIDGANVINQPVEGIATLGVAINAGQVTSLVESSNLAVSLTNRPLDSATNDANVISASTTINKGVSTVSGQVPNGFTSSTDGSAFIDQFAGSYYVAETGDILENRLNTTGTIAVSTLQEAIPGSNSYADARNNDITLDMLSDGEQTTTGSGSLDVNSIAAIFAGNNASSTVSIESGANPAFTGSAVVTTSQTYTGNALDDQASNYRSTIAARVESTTLGEGTLSGALTVDGNAITASATGNLSLNNAITLDGSVNLAGPNASASAVLDDTGGQQDTSANGTLALVSNQLNNPADYFATEGGFNRGAISSVTEWAEISGYAEEIINGSLSVSGNAISSTAKGNQYSGEIATNGTVTSFSGGTVLAAMQSNENVDVNATVQHSDVLAHVGSWAGEVSASTVSVLNNNISAAAYGNQANHSIVLDATSLNTANTGLADLEAHTDGWVNPVGSVVLGSQQTSYESAVTANNVDSLIKLESSDEFGTQSSSLIVGNNNQEAVAVSNLVSNSVDLIANTIGGGIGLVSQQLVDLNAPVSASLESSANVYIAEDLGDNGANTLSLIDNTARAVAYGSSASNDLSVTATTALISANNSTASNIDNTTTAYNQVYAAYGVLNSQATSSNVTASVAPNANGWSNFEVYVGSNVQDGSAVRNDGNDIVAAAYGASSANSATLTVNTLSVTDGLYAPIANVSNGQYLDNAATVSAQVLPNGDAVVRNEIWSQVYGGSSVSASDNNVQAQALGNTTANTLIVDATGISANKSGDATAYYESESDYASVESALSVNNSQRADWNTTVQSTLRDSFGLSPTQSAEIRTSTGGGVYDSSVVSLANTLTATSGANRAVNTLDLNTTSLDASVAVNNYQTAEGATLATIGVQGSPPIDGVTSVYNGAGTSTDGTTAGSNLTSYSFGTDLLSVADGETVTLNQGAMSSAEWAAIVNYLTNVVGGNRWTATSATSIATTGNGDYDVSIFTGFTYATGDAVGHGIAAYNGFSFGGSAGTANGGGIFITTDNDIARSTLRVDDNIVTGQAVGNDVTNSLTVVATSTTQSSTNTQTHAHDWDVDADVALGNWQFAQEASNSTVKVFNTFAIDQSANYAIDNSLLSVSGNNQSATAVANLADNSLSLTSTDLASSPTTTGLASLQETWFGAEVSATSNMQIFAPIQSTGSTISLNDNTNSALGVHNDVVNSLTVIGTNIGSISDNTADLSDSSGSTAYADNALNNDQRSSGTLSTTATTNIYNQEIDNVLDTATNGVINGTVELNGNRTLAESSANRAVNSVLVDGTANQGSASGLASHQTSSTNVTATATSTVRVDLNGTDLALTVNDRAPLNSSSVSIEGNVTQALARGNTATNVMTSAAGANYPALPDTAANSGSYNNGVRASSAVLNQQANTGAVTATANLVTYAVALNSAGGAPSVTNSTVSVANNTAAAVSYGNQSTNRLTLTPLNSGMATGAVYNAQTNSGPITATATSVSFSIGAGAGLTNGSTFRGTGNAITATAVGNSAVSGIVAK